MWGESWKRRGGDGIHNLTVSYKYEEIFWQCFTAFKSSERNGWWGFDVLVNMAQPYWQPSNRQRNISKAGLFLLFSWMKTQKVLVRLFSVSGFCSTKRRWKLSTWIVEINPASPVNPQLGSHWVGHRPRHHVEHLRFGRCWFRPL